MTIEYGKALLTPFIDSAKKDADAFFTVHFSKIEDRYSGDHNGMDALDAMIIIKQLVKDFKIDSVLLNTAAIEEVAIEEKEKLVGTLAKRYGLNSYHTAEVGHPVYEYKDRYVIYLEPINPTWSKYRVPFYKGDLTINFNQQ